MYKRSFFTGSQKLYSEQNSEIHRAHIKSFPERAGIVQIFAEEHQINNRNWRLYAKTGSIVRGVEVFRAGCSSFVVKFFIKGNPAADIRFKYGNKRQTNINIRTDIRFLQIVRFAQHIVFHRSVLNEHSRTEMEKGKPAGKMDSSAIVPAFGIECRGVGFVTPAEVITSEKFTINKRKSRGRNSNHREKSSD
jgi:hypothetical protein